MKRTLTSFFLFVICLYDLNAQNIQDSICVPGLLIVKFNKEYATLITQENRNPLENALLNNSLESDLLHVISVESLNLKTKAAIQSVQADIPDYFDHVYRLRFKSEAPMTKIVQAYLSKGCFEYVSPDYIVRAESLAEVIPNDTLYYNRQWSHFNDGSFVFSNEGSKPDADIDMEQAWELTQGDTSTIVCIIDTGAKLSHPEFKERIWTNPSEIPDNQQDDDQNGFVDDVMGWDFVNWDNNPSDDHGHGTHVAGILGATGNNHIGYAGVNWNCKLMICKLLNSNSSGSSSNIAQGIVYAVNQGADVINLSLVTAFDNPLLKDAIRYAHEQGVVIVAAIGNNGNASTLYPAAYPETIAVGFSNSQDKRADFSNFGTHLDVVAPGQYIFGLQYNSDEAYNFVYSGSSMAAPLVSGLASLLLAQNPELTSEQIRQIIQNTAEDQVGDPVEDTPGWDTYYGFGRINAQSALNVGKLPNKPKILSFTLVDADTNEDILELEDGMLINNLFQKNLSIRVNTIPDQTGSILIGLEGTLRHQQTENIFPYTLFGDNSATGYIGKGFPPGTYQISATPYSEKKLTGVGGETQTVSFTVEGNPVITQLVLVDAATGQDIQTLDDSTLLVNLASLNQGISIRAEVDFAKGVIFVIKDQYDSIIHRKIERIQPLTLFGDDLQGNYYPWYPQEGFYQLSFTPFINIDLVSGSGGAETRTFNFQIIHKEDSTESSRQFNVFPNPSSGVVHFRSRSANYFPGTLTILRSPDQIVFEQAFEDELDLSIDLSPFGKGIYITQISDQEGIIQKTIIIE
ncbi:MAG: S8 family serine peptidase [Microscillaceae bacterium]|nr:S8 family serine peptidase [Microscillaceae bacterium]